MNMSKHGVQLKAIKGSFYDQDQTMPEICYQMMTSMKFFTEGTMIYSTSQLNLLSPQTISSNLKSSLKQMWLILPY